MAGHRTIESWRVYHFFFSGSENSHHFGSGFAVHRSVIQYIKEFNPVSERISVLTLTTNPINLSIINSHAPTEGKDDVEKELFYEQLTDTYERNFGNVIKIVLGDINAKFGREQQYLPTIGRESLHINSNDNGD